MSAVSTIASEYLRYLSEGIDSEGNISFPSEDFNTWTPGDEGEMVMLYKEKLILSVQESSVSTLPA